MTRGEIEKQCSELRPSPELYYFPLSAHGFFFFFFFVSTNLAPRLADSREQTQTSLCLAGQRFSPLHVCQRRGTKTKRRGGEKKKKVTFHISDVHIWSAENCVFSPKRSQEDTSQINVLTQRWIRLAACVCSWTRAHLVPPCKLLCLFIFCFV